MLAASIVPVRAPHGLPSYFDKVVHLGQYLGLAWLILKALQAGGPRRGDGWRAWGLAAAYGIVIEAVQVLVPWRAAEWADLLMDAVGAGIGVGLGHARRRVLAEGPGSSKHPTRSPLPGQSS